MRPAQFTDRDAYQILQSNRIHFRPDVEQKGGRAGG
jgi:hypothetical protein